MVCTLSSTFDNFLCFSYLNYSYTYQLMLQLFHNCVVMFSILCCPIYFVSILVYYSCLLFFVCTYCPVLTCFIFSCPMISTGFFEMYICMCYPVIMTSVYATPINSLPLTITLSFSVKTIQFITTQRIQPVSQHYNQLWLYLLKLQICYD